LLLLTHRYVHLFLDELNLLRLTLRTRAYRNRVARQAYRTIGHVAGALLVRSYERAERVDQAMRCRGFDGRLHALRTWRLRWRDPCWALALMLLAGALPLAIDLWARD
jgi:cobalt/nickel transport system permease protein